MKKHRAGAVRRRVGQSEDKLPGAGTITQSSDPWSKDKFTGRAGTTVEIACL